MVCSVVQTSALQVHSYCGPMLSCTVHLNTFEAILLLSFFLQMLTNVQGIVMAVSIHASTQTAPFSVPVEMGSVLPVMGGAVKVRVSSV